MSALRDIPKRGTVSLIHGGMANMQSFVANELAYRCARAGRHVVVLSPIAEVIDCLITWRAARGVQVGERLRLEHFDDHDFEREADLGMALFKRLRAKGIKPDVVVANALMLDVGGICGRLGERYLSAAKALVRANCAVVLAGHTGPVPNNVALLMPDIQFLVSHSDFKIELWHCAASINLEVRLTGPDGEIIDLRGKEHGGSGLRTSVVMFDKEAADA